MNILLVDDDEVDVMTVKRAFKRQKLSHSIVVCGNGLEALEHLRTTDTLPDVCFFDINMPRMGGLELLKALRHDPQFCGLRVIMLTTSKADFDVCAAYDLHVSGYIVKPVKFDEFVDAVGVLDDYWQLSRQFKAA